MYNRYIPQPDGSYRRNRMQEPQRPVPPPVQSSAPPEVHKDDAPVTDWSNRPARRRSPAPPSPAGSFLRQLLPGNLDTEDLLVVVLLLLMAGDCEEDRNTALLTLALYLFL